MTQSSIKKLGVCVGLRYLDLSYTSVSDITSIANSCEVLRSLQLSGTSLSTYEPLSKLVSLELLNLNFSKIPYVTPIISLYKLRSLDLGHTPIISIKSLNECTRLEELLLDSCGIQDTQNVTESLTCIEGMTSLKYMNVGATELVAWTEHIADLSNGEIAIESKPRK